MSLKPELTLIEEPEPTNRNLTLALHANTARLNARGMYNNYA